MEKSVTEQEREIKDVVKRADKNLDRNGPFRRDTLKRLIGLTHSHHSALKCYAAGNIRLFFKDFPDLEEEAINAVYDLCEDQVPRVRMEGYAAIVQVSKEQKKWVKRNADVLVQLLQSDEHEEVIVVKRALLEHLDMDPPATLGVLCDQIVHPQEPMEEEEQQTRDNLRSLVISFLVGEAKRGIARHANRLGSEAEAALVDELLAAIPRLSNAEIEKIVKDLLLGLPSFSSIPSRGNDLLRVILDKAKSTLHNDTRSGTASLKTTRFFFDLASSLAVEKAIASPVDLLRFYCRSLSKISLSGLPKDDYVYFIARVAETLGATEDELKHPDVITKSQWDILREQVVTLTPTMVNLLAQSRMTSADSWRACGPLLRACLTKKADATWTMPLPLTSSLRAIQTLGQQVNDSDKKIIDKTQELIRLLLTPPAVPAPAIGATPDIPKQKPDIHPMATQILPITNSPARSGLDRLPPRPQPLAQPRVERSEPRSSSHSNGLNIHGARLANSAGPSTMPNKRELVTDETSQPHKKPKRNGSSTDAVPSLLSRLAGPSASTSIVVASTQRRPENRPPVAASPHHGLMDLDDDINTPAGGWSIRGAAGRPEESKPTSLSRSSPSLLDRMKGVDIPLGVGDRGGVKKRYKGRT